MSSNNEGKKFSKLGPKAQLEAVKAAQPQPLIEVKVMVLSDGQVRVIRPEGDDVRNLAGVMDLLATGIKIIAHKLAQCQGEASRIVVPPLGMKVQ